MRTTEAPTERSAHGSPTPAEAFGKALDAAVGAVATKVEHTATGWIDKLAGVADSGGVVQRAGVEGVKARVRGTSPTWAVIRTLWQTGTPAVRAAVVTAAVAAVLLLLLSPALLLVYLVAWLLVAAVCRSREARRRRPAAA